MICLLCKVTMAESDFQVLLDHVVSDCSAQYVHRMRWLIDEAIANTPRVHTRAIDCGEAALVLLCKAAGGPIR